MAFDTPTSEALARRFPSVEAALKKVPVAPAAPFDVKIDLAVMWAQAQVKAPKPNTLYIVSGFGEHVWALLPRIDASAYVVVYEPSLERLRATLEMKDWSGVLQDERVHLFAGQVGAGEFERLHQLPLARVGDVQALRFSLAWQMDEKAYAAFFTEFAKQFEVTRRLHLTNFNDSLFWQAMSIKNLQQHCQAPDVAALKGLAKDVPVVLVGAGPSLDEAGEFLKQAQDRALIIAVNSSYRKLRNIGIKPHLVLAADPREDTAKGFHNMPTDGCYLVAPFIANDKAIEAFGGRAFSWSGENNYLICLLRKRLGLGGGTSVLEKGTVSVAVADVAFLMGAKRLILVGQDMAIRDDGQTHAGDSIYEGFKLTPEELKSQKESARGATKKVEGNTKTEVLTLNNLFVYLKIFEQWVEAHPQVEVLNTSRLGAKIKGAAYVDYAAALGKLSGSPLYLPNRIAEAFQNSPEKAIAFDRWKETLKPIFDFAQKLYNLALKAAVGLEALPERFWLAAYKEKSEIKEIYDAAAAINVLIEKNPDDYRVLIEGRLKKALLQFQAQAGVIEGSNPFAEELMRNREFFWALVEGIEPLLGLLSQKITQEETVEV